MEPTITLGASTTHDETAGLQNLTATGTFAGDSDDNDIALASLPQEFDDRLHDDPSLGGLGLDAPMGAALSGYTGANSDLDNSDLDAFTVSSTGTISNLAFVDAYGNPHDPHTGDPADSDSGLTTLDGNKIFLYTDPTNDNIVYGREGTNSTPNASGDVVFALYIEQNTDLTAA